MNGYISDERLQAEGVQRNLMPLFLIVDTSGSMSGTRIEQVKSAIEEIKIELAKMNAENDDAEIKVSVLRFDDNVRWEAKMEDPSLINPNLEVGVITNMGMAFVELEKMLSRSQLIQRGQCAGYKRAVMILLSDGAPTDDYLAGIKKLKTNNWFVKGTRIAFAIGDDIGQGGMSCLKEFTGNPETIIRIGDNSMKLLSTILSNVAVVASETATHGIGVSNEENSAAQKDADFAKTAKEAAEIVENTQEELVVKGVIDDDDDIFGSWDKKKN